jgi:hypothetical protein
MSNDECRISERWACFVIRHSVIRHWFQVRVPRKRRHAPIRDDYSKQEKCDRNRRAKARAPVVVEANVADTVEAVIESDEQERDVDRYEPGILKKASLDDLKREAGRCAHFGRKMFDPEVHDKEQQERCARNALKVPINCSTGHRSTLQEYSHDTAGTTIILTGLTGCTGFHSSWLAEDDFYIQSIL